MPATDPFGGYGSGGYSPTPLPPQQPSPKQMMGINDDPYNLKSSIPAPSFESPFDSNGHLLAQFDGSKGLDQIHLNKSPLQQLEAYGAGTGDSPWAQAQLSSLANTVGTAQGNVGATVKGASTSAADSLASHGGLTEGARENLARNEQNNLVTAKQGVAGQGIQGALGIRAQDASNRLGVLENLPGQEVQATQPDLQKQSLWEQAANSGLNQLTGLNQFNQQLYQNQINDQAGKSMANAYANKGKK